jgi:hypothetical protein
MGAVGIENSREVGIGAKLRDSVALEKQNEHIASPAINDLQPVASLVASLMASGAPSIGDALAFALMEAAKAGRFDVVAQLAKELEARRLADASAKIARTGQP